MASKAVTDRQKTEAALVGVLASWQEKTSAALEEVLAPLGGDGARDAGLAVFQGLLGGRLQRLRTRMVEADEHHRRESLKDRRLRGQRDEAAGTLGHRLSRLRAILEQACGLGTFEQLWDFEGPMSKDPVVLQRIGRRVVESLEQGEASLPTSEVPGVDLTPEAWLTYLGEPLGRLSEALHDLSQEVPGTRKAVVDRRAAIHEYDRAYGATARILENLLIYAGRDDLAVYVRPKRRRSRSAFEEAPETLTPEKTQAELADSPAEPDAETAAAPPDPDSPEHLEGMDEGADRDRKPGLPPPERRARRGLLSIVS